MNSAHGTGEAMSTRPFVIVLIFLASLASPLSDSFLGEASAADTLVCCDSASVNLHLLGSASAGTLSPFSEDLAETETTATIANAVTSEETVGKWVLPNVWPGTIPANTWDVSIQYEVSSAASAQVNATASLKIGSQTFTASTEPGNSILPQGTGTLNFAIDVDATSISDMGAIELTLSARSVVFTLPTGDAKLEFIWGTSDSDSTVEGEIPLFDLVLAEPEVEGSDVYFSVLIDSNWGMDMLSKSNSLEIIVNGQSLTGDPIETSSDGGVRVTWTWQGAKGGVEVVTVEAQIIIESGGETLKGSTEFEIETFDTSGGTGTYYPPEEPLKTNGDGSPISVSGTFMLNKNSEGELQLERTTRIEVGDEMAFWMRWGMDHLGDEVTTLSPVLKSFDAGAVTDEERVSRSIETSEKIEFERQMERNSATLASYYLSVGLGITVDDLFGSPMNDLVVRSINVDLYGEQDVVNHPVGLVFTTTEVLGDDDSSPSARISLIQDFITFQPVPLWSDVSISLEGKSTEMTSFEFPKVEGSKSLKMSHLRFPWGETLSLEGNNLDPEDTFVFNISPSESPLAAPLTLLILTLTSLLFGFLFALRITRNRRRSVLYLEMILIPVVAIVHLLAFSSVIVGGATAVVVVIWWVTSVTSPRSRKDVVEEAITLTTPVIPCPACSTPNPVPSDERPLRFACIGCQRVIKIVA